jgi:hypothetical protein
MSAADVRKSIRIAVGLLLAIAALGGATPAAAQAWKQLTTSPQNTGASCLSRVIPGTETIIAPVAVSNIQYVMYGGGGGAGSSNVASSGCGGVGGGGGIERHL